MYRKAELNKTWEWEITPKTTWFGVGLAELINYKDLLLQMVRRNFILYYHQTLLGPLWMVINPILTVIVYMLIFSKVIGVPTEGIPAFAYYLTGITLWTLFNDIFSGTNNFISANAYIFGKVYFPRLVIPFSTTLLHLLRFSIQLGILILVLTFYQLNQQISLSFFRSLIFIPVVLIMACSALGLGLIFSVAVAKYKDLSNLMALITRLLLFLCPVFYSKSIVPANMQWLIQINPLSSLFEHFRYAFLGTGVLSIEQLAYSGAVSVILLLTGILLFNKIGDRLLDVI